MKRLLPVLALLLCGPAHAARYYTPAEVAQAQRAALPYSLAQAQLLAIGDPLAGELALHARLLALRAQEPTPALRAEVEALLDYAPVAVSDPPEPEQRRLQRVVDIAAAARGTLRTWELPDRARRYVAPGARAKAGGAPDVITYVEVMPVGGCPTPRCDVLGYPVPLPIDSPMPTDGFRSYASLHARLASVAAGSADIVEHEVGRTVYARAIDAYVVGDADAITVDGFAEPAALIDGTIHAREWASPETVAGLVERFAERAHDGGLYRYLLDNVNLVVLPVLNVDGFLQTQRYPSRALTDIVTEEPVDWPRDGRMRRKNLRDADEDLLTLDDYLFGVDCNRNNAPFFDSGNQNSDDPRALLYHGAAAGSEPETQALYAAAGLAPESRLRFYLDVHSYGRDLLAVDTGNARRDRLQRALAGVISAPTGNRYNYAATPANTGIGSTDEHFAYADQIPAMTLELEPAVSTSEYGGFGVTHDGFILPASQIARVREEIADALAAGIYRMAGPPAIAAVTLADAGGAVVFQAHWTRQGPNARTLTIDQRSALVAGHGYTLTLAFDKPMRVRSDAVIAQYRGFNVALAPAITLEGIDSAGGAWHVDVPVQSSGWAGASGAHRYADDTFTASFTIPAATPVAGARRIALAVTAADFTGAALDANPATAVDFAGGAWARYEDGAGATTTDTGGTDRSLRIVDDGSPLFPAPAPPPSSGGGGGGGGGASTPGALLALLLAALRRRRA